MDLFLILACGFVNLSFRSPIVICESDFRADVTVVVATEDFCTGTDAPDVRTVLFAGGARSLLEFWAKGGARRTGWKGGWRSRLVSSQSSGSGEWRTRAFSSLSVEKCET